jgi:hypothetical protein
MALSTRRHPRSRGYPSSSLKRWIAGSRRSSGAPAMTQKRFA